MYAKNFKPRKASTAHWMDISVGSSACHIGYSQLIKRNTIVVELYINEDKQLFHSLLQHKETIEQEMGMMLDWRELPEKKASRILVEKSVNLADREQWNAQFEWIIDVALKMKKAFKKYL